MNTSDVSSRDCDYRDTAHEEIRQLLERRGKLSDLLALVPQLDSARRMMELRPVGAEKWILALYCALNDAVSVLFADHYHTALAGGLDSAAALDSARETASAAVPADVTGFFDDETLTFVADSSSAEVES